MYPPSGLVFFHNPHSRATMTQAAGRVRCELRAVRRRFPARRAALARIPGHQSNGQGLAIRRDGVVVTETVAIFICLADRYREAGLAPALDDPARAPYLRWLVFRAACFEPAVGDRAMKRAPAPHMQSPYADYDTTVAATGEIFAATRERGLDAYLAHAGVPRQSHE